MTNFIMVIIDSISFWIYNTPSFFGLRRDIVLRGNKIFSLVRFITALVIGMFWMTILPGQPVAKAPIQSFKYVIDGQTYNLEVKVSALVKSQYMPAKEMGLRTMNSKRIPIDLNQWNDASIRINVQLISAPPGHYIDICKDCLQDNLNGFSRSGGINPKIRKIDDFRDIKYKYNDEFIDASGNRGEINFSFVIKNQNSGVSPKKHFSWDYRIIKDPPNRDNFNPETSLENIIAQFESENSLGDPCQPQFLTYVKKFKLNFEQTEKLRAEIQKRCKDEDKDEIAIGGQRPEINPPDPNPQDLIEARRRRVEESYDILELSREEISNKRKAITIKINVANGELFKLRSAEKDVRIVEIGKKNHRQIIVPNNSIRKIQINFSDIGLTKTHVIDATIPPLEATFTKDGNDLQIEIKESTGSPPFIAKFYEGEDLAGQIKLGNSRNLVIKSSDISKTNMPEGIYTIKIVDSNNSASANSIHENYQFSRRFPWGRALIFGVSLLALLAGIYLLYFRHLRQQKVSPEFLNKVKPKIELGNKKEEDKLSAVQKHPDSQPQNQSEVRKKITVNKPAENLPAIALLANRPRPQTLPLHFAKAQAVREGNFLEYSIDKYRRLDMEELWEETAVAGDLYQ